MKLKFDSKLEYQQEAIGSVTDLFEGLPSNPGDLRLVLVHRSSWGHSRMNLVSVML